MQRALDTARFGYIHFNTVRFNAIRFHPAAPANGH